MARPRELSPLSAKTPATMVQRQAERLVGMPLSLDRTERLGPLGQVWAMREHAMKKRKGSEYRSNFYLFLTTCVFTKDEAGGGKVRQFPDYPYILDLCDDAMEESIQIWEKARRVLASWVACALDLWIIGGGWDERWPALVPDNQNPRGENRQVILAARKLEDIQGSAWFLEERVRFIYEQFEERNFRKLYWPDFPEIQFSFGTAKATNGGRINAVPQGSDQMRGPGATLIHAEEIAFWSELKKTISGAIPVLQGGGHFLGLTTANAISYCKEIVLDEIDP